MKCPSCGVWNRSHMKKCFRCGADLPPADESARPIRFGEPVLPQPQELPDDEPPQPAPRPVLPRGVFAGEEDDEPVTAPLPRFGARRRAQEKPAVQAPPAAAPEPPVGPEFPSVP